jgi:lysophospholipase L1-like esterase
VKRAADIALAALGVLVVIAAVYVSTHNDSPDGGRAGASVSTLLPSTVASPSVTRSAATAHSTSPAPTKSDAAEPVAAFLGDDWTVGAGTSAKSQRFATLLSTALHLKQRNFGSDGAGYGNSAGAYSDQVDKIVAAHPDLVIVSGGRNDLNPGHDLAVTASDINQLFRDLRDGLPNATLIAVAPFWGDSDLPPALDTLGQEVKDAVTAVHGTYLGIEDPIHGHPDFMANDADPNDDGHAAIAAALQPKVAALLPS